VKKIFIAIAAIILIAAIAFILFFPRIEKEALDFLARRILPPDSDFREITLDKEKNRILITDFTLRNVPGYRSKNILEIDKIILNMKGKLYGEDAIRVEEVLLKGASLFLERDKQGKFNIEQADSYAKQAAEKPETGKTAKMLEKIPTPEMILPAKIILTNSNLYFEDDLTAETRKMGIYQVDAVMRILDRKAEPMLAPVDAEGEAKLNKDRSGKLKFKMQTHYPAGNIHFDSNYIISGYDLKEVMPYLNEQIPFEVKSGTANGNIIFTYNGTQKTMGMNNTFEFFNLDYSVKQGKENTQFIETTAGVLSKYLATQRGGILFDFKVKGPVDNPRFYLGPLTKRGISMAVIDTFGSQILKAPGEQLKELNIPDFFEQFMQLIK
jgi:hypothetical protein